MRILPAALTAHLAGGVTTLCHCWKVTRSDASVMGFTDHDEAVAFDGVNYEAASGFEATAIEGALGLGVPNQDAMGALSSAAISEADLAAGRYDNASVEIWRVNWADVSQRVLLSKGEIGAIARGPQTFTAELRGLAHKLNQPIGRAYQFMCDADLGDARCTIDLNAAAYTGAGAVVTAADRRRFAHSGLGAFASGWFAGGRILWTGGLNAGLAQIVKAHDGNEIALWEPMPFVIGPSDAFTVTAGCDKRFDTCKAKFNNRLNFRGFPHMPGNDWVTSYPRSGEGHNGGSLNQT
jgi:uncharacterized phage protein (TIGR02218 family)